MCVATEAVERSEGPLGSDEEYLLLVEYIA